MVGNGDGGGASDKSGNQHGLIARQDGLAPGHLGTTLVDGLDGSGSLDTVGLVVEGLLNLTVIVTVQAAVLRDESVGFIEQGDQKPTYH